MINQRIENERSRKFIQETFEKEFHAQERLLEDTIKAMDALEKDSDFPKKITTCFGLSTYALFLKDFNTFWATYILCKEGFGSEAMITVRSLFNLVINLLWISKKDSEERAERFLAFDIVYKKYRRDVVKSHNPNLPDPPNFLEIENQYNSLKKRYGLTGDRKKDRWHDGSIAKMAEEVDKKKDYEIIYSYLSEVEHSGASSLTRYVKVENDTWKLLPGASTELINMALMLNYNNFYTLLRQVNSLIPLQITLEDRKKDFENLYKISPSEP
jgi:hypothetical protein